MSHNIITLETPSNVANNLELVYSLEYGSSVYRIRWDTRVNTSQFLPALSPLEIDPQSFVWHIRGGKAREMTYRELTEIDGFELGIRESLRIDVGNSNSEISPLEVVGLSANDIEKGAVTRIVKPQKPYDMTRMLEGIWFANGWGEDDYPSFIDYNSHLPLSDRFFGLFERTSDFQISTEDKRRLEDVISELIPKPN